MRNRQVECCGTVEAPRGQKNVCRSPVIVAQFTGLQLRSEMGSLAVGVEAVTVVVVSAFDPTCMLSLVRDVRVGLGMPASAMGTLDTGSLV